MTFTASNDHTLETSAFAAAQQQGQNCEISPVEKLSAAITVAVSEFAETRTDELGYTEINLLLNAGGEVLGAVPSLTDDRREKTLQKIAGKLDKLCRATGKRARTQPNEVAGRGTAAKRKIEGLKLYATGTLTAGQIDEYSALLIMPKGEARDARIEAFRAELEEAGIEAMLTTGDEVGPGRLIYPQETGVYDIHYNYDD